MGRGEKSPYADDDGDVPKRRPRMPLRQRALATPRHGPRPDVLLAVSHPAAQESPRSRRRHRRHSPLNKEATGELPRRHPCSPHHPVPCIRHRDLRIPFQGQKINKKVMPKTRKKIREKPKRIPFSPELASDSSSLFFFSDL